MIVSVYFFAHEPSKEIWPVCHQAVFHVNRGRYNRPYKYREPNVKNRFASPRNTLCHHHHNG